MHHIPAPLLDFLEKLPRDLRAHIERVRRVARELAEANDLNLEQADLGAAGHDVARMYSPEWALSRARELGIKLHPVDERLPILMHGPVGAHMLRDLGVRDEEVLEGVYWHSTANQNLSPLGRLVFLADKLDPQKAERYPFIGTVHELALQDLDAGVLEFLNRELYRLIKSKGLVHPASIDARNTLLLRLASSR